MSKKSQPGKKSEPLNHHFVARFHLRNWLENGHLSEYDKFKKTTKIIGVKDAACEYKFNDLIAFTNPELQTEETRNIVEKWAGEEENKAAPRLKKLIEGGPGAQAILDDTDSRKIALRYTAFQLCRSPGMRKTVGDLRSGRARMILNEAMKKENMPPIVGHLSDEELIFFEENEFAKIQHFASMIEYTSRLAHLFATNYAIVLKHDPETTCRLIISDFAVVGDVESIDFVLPLSPNTAIYLRNNQHGHRIETLTDSEIDFFNSLQMQQGSKIYCTKESINRVVETLELHPDWCQTDEEIFAREKVRYEASAHWYELPGVQARTF